MNRSEVSIFGASSEAFKSAKCGQNTNHQQSQSQLSRIRREGLSELIQNSPVRSDLTRLEQRLRIDPRHGFPEAILIYAVKDSLAD